MKYAKTLMLGLALFAAGPVLAQSYTTYYFDGTFEDGGLFSGYFEYYGEGAAGLFSVTTTPGATIDNGDIYSSDNLDSFYQNGDYFIFQNDTSEFNFSPDSFSSDSGQIVGGYQFDYVEVTERNVAGGTYSAVPMTPAVPEPSTWAMMILGFGLVGYQLRRQKRERTGTLATA